MTDEYIPDEECDTAVNDALDAAAARALTTTSIPKYLRDALVAWRGQE